MHEVYVYDSGQNYDGLGLVGALSAISCIHDEVGGGDSEVTLEHPFDELGKWTALTEGRYLKCWVPVRETPKLKMDGTDSTQTITREVYRVKTNGGRLRLRKSPNTSAKILGRYNPGAEVVKLADAGTASGHDWYQVSVVKDGSTGYMAATYLEYVRSYTESAAGDVTLESSDTAGQANWVVRPQIFEIYRRELTDDGVVVHARHISYKLLKNATTYAPSGAVTMQQALNGILDNCETPHDFRAYTDINETRDGISWKLINPIKAMLDKENGALVKWNAQLIRDNWDLFFIRRAGRNRGIRVEYGKNLAGVNYSEDTLNTATRILPVGQNKDGTELFLPERYVDSPHIGEYDEPMIYPLKCSDCKVSNKQSKEAVYEKMRKQVQELLNGGCDLPAVSVKVDFISLGDTEEYAQFRALDKLFLYDEIQLVAIRGYLNISAQVVALSWDCLHDRAVGLEIGTVGVSLSGSKLASWQIPGGISGSKITDGSIGAAQLGADIISARHMQANSINAEAIQAGSITAEKIAAGAINAMAIEALRAHINELVAGSVTTDQLYADLAFIAAAQITAANIEKANIDWAQIGTLTAQIATIARAEITEGNIQWAEIETLNTAIASIAQAKIEDAEITSAQITDLEAIVAKIFTASIGTADIGFAQIKDLVANQAIITEGVGGQLYIARLAVTEANMVSLSVGELMVKGDDGHFYSVGVDADGEIKTTLKQIVNGDIANQTIHGTQKLIEGSITAQVLNVQNIFGDSAIIRELIAANLDVDTLFAREATIKALNAVDIRGNEYLKLSVEGKSTVYRGERPPAGGSANDLFIQNSTGYTFQRVDAGAMLPEFYIDETGILYYRYADGQTAYQLYMDANGDLYIEDNPYLTLAIGEDGMPEWWARVKDSQLECEAQEALAAAKAAQDTANQNAIDMANVVTQLNADIAGLQDQIDSSITSWFIKGEPTADNYPANQWTTDDLKNAHLGDLCYDENTGYCYRWLLAEDGYRWVKITDTEVTKALADAAKAQDTADSKRRVFVATPTPPYDVGDIWAQGAAGDIMLCQVAKVAGQGYAASDWVKASKYTDDTKANQNAATITEHAAAIDLNKRNIELRVTSKTFNETVRGLRESISETDARIDVKAGEVLTQVGKTYATQSDLNATNESVKTAQAAIQTNADQIALKVGTAQYTAEKIYRSNTAPSTPLSNMMWLDTSLTPAIMKRWDGSAWAAVGAQEVNASGITINDDRVAITTEDFLLQLLDPANNENVMMEMSANGNVGFNRLYAEEVASESVAQAYMGPATLYVDPAYIGDSDAYFRSLSDALNTINHRYLRRDVTIELPSVGTLYETGVVAITGIFGPGTLTIDGHSSTLNGALHLRGCCARISIDSLRVRESRSWAGNLVYARGCSDLDIYSCKFDGNGIDNNCIYAETSDVRIRYSEFYNAGTALHAYRGAAQVYSCKGACTTAMSAEASTIYAYGTIPGGSLTKVANGQIYSDGTTVDYGSATPTVQPEATASFTADTTRTHRGSWRTDTQDVIQGAYAEGGYGNVQNWNYGGMWFSTLRGTLSGKTVKGATITLKRIKAGANAARSIYLCALTNTSPSGSPVIAKNFGAIGTLAVNTQGTFALPADAVQGLADGTYGALALYETPYDFGSGNYSRNYMRIYGANSDTPPVLTVVYS